MHTKGILDCIFITVAFMRANITTVENPPHVTHNSKRSQPYYFWKLYRTPVRINLEHEQLHQFLSDSLQIENLNSYQ